MLFVVSSLADSSALDRLFKEAGAATVRITRDTYRDFLQSPPDATSSSGVS